MRYPLAAVIICTTLVLFQESPGGSDKILPVPNGVSVTCPGLCVRVQFYGSDIVRVVKWLPGGSEKKTSLSVTMQTLPPLPVKISESGGNVVVSAGGTTVTISTGDGSILYTNSRGVELLREGRCEFAPVAYGSDRAYSVKQKFDLSPGEGVFGLGEHQSGFMNYRGKTVNLVQTNTEDIVPFLISTRPFGILWDNYSRSVYADDGRREASFWSDVADNIDYYFIAGATMDSVIGGYRTLTGGAPMYGKWAYGYWQSKEHYRTGDELFQVASEYRKRHMPIDNIVQDWDYWNGRENWSGMFFDSTLFPDPARMVEKLHAMHFHMMISVWPALGARTPIYADMMRHGYLYSPVGWGGFRYYDAFRPAANRLYWTYLKTGILSTGIDALWIDSTEPDIRNANTKESTEYEMKRVEDNFRGSWARYLNAYSLAMTDDLYSSWRNDMPAKRCYILTRSTFAGQQRNAATTWTGDIGASWEIFRHQISAGINHCMSGVPYWTFDIGGFVLGSYDGVFCNGGKDPAYQELYARMFQLGAFSPIFRSHGSETPREIWEMGEFIEPILKADKLRYRLMPYIYSLAWKVTSGGYTIMRGLPMDFPADTNTYSIDNEFMFGPSLLVTPVTGYMYHRPPEPSVPVGPEVFMTDGGGPGLLATYCRDNAHRVPTRQEVEPDIDVDWYGGRPAYVTDSMFSVRWKGRLVPLESGLYQFHMKSYDAKRIFIDGKELPAAYTSVEQYTDTVSLRAGTSYDFALETENSSTGAARMKLFWKTPAVFARERTAEDRPKTWPVYLPAGGEWYDFWTGEKRRGGRVQDADAPIDRIPLFVKAGSVVPLGPFLEYSTEKPADPLELRVYAGADCVFVLYEDENDGDGYEKGARATIEFRWDDVRRVLSIGKRKGEFPGMPRKRTIDIVVVSKNHGGGMDITTKPDRTVLYDGAPEVITLSNKGDRHGQEN